MDPLLAELAGHDVARLAAVAGAVDHEVEVRAQPRLEGREGRVEVGLGQGEGARDVAHLVEVDGAGVEEEGALVEPALGLGRLDDLVPGLDEDALAEGEARGPRTRSRRSPSAVPATRIAATRPPAASTCIER